MIYSIAAALLTITVIFLIRAEYYRDKKQVYFFKPLSTILVIAAACIPFIQGGYNFRFSALVVSGLILSLGGDIALISDSKRAFISGLVLFLAAHIVYSIAFTLVSGFIVEDAISGGIIIIAAAAVYRFFYPVLGSLKIPVLLYILIISFMLNRAVSTLLGSSVTPAASLLILAGAALFYASDFLLALHKFREPLAVKYNLAVYFSGQLLIAMSTGYVGV